MYIKIKSSSWVICTGSLITTLFALVLPVFCTVSSSEENNEPILLNVFTANMFIVGDNFDARVDQNYNLGVCIVGYDGYIVVEFERT